MEKLNKVDQMEIGERMIVTSDELQVWVLRIYGGWIYTTILYGDFGAKTSIFVSNNSL